MGKTKQIENKFFRVFEASALNKILVFNLILIFIASLSVSYVFAAIVSHTAEQVRVGIFGNNYTGNWSFMNGSVGIGTTTPSSLLTVGVSSGTNEVNLSGVLYVNSTSGNVGIGTTSPTATLQVNSSNSNGAFAVYNTSGSSLFFVNGSSGKVGIGTTDPTAALYVQPSATEDEALMLRPKSGLSGYTLTFKLNDTAAYITHDSSIRKLILGTNNRADLVIDGSGNVGIGTTAPDTTLEVTGGLCVSDAAADNCTTTSGNIQADGTITQNAFDIAERIWSDEKLEAGDVVVIDTNSNEKIKKSAKAYDTTVAGIVSTKPGNILGWEDKGNTLLSLAGRVPVKVTAENGAIKPGDLLTTSSKPGYAMKCNDKLKCIGAIVGKALEPLEKGTGTIIALVTLQ